LAALPEISASNTLSIASAMRLHFLDMGGSNISSRIPASGRGYFTKPTWRIGGQVRLPVSLASKGYSCIGIEYSPTWWLTREVESRRAAHFAAMSDIACEYELPVSLLDAVIAQESGYKAWAVSGAGAMGMMQVMPGTAKHLELWNPWDALANMRAGARYLRQRFDRFGRVDLALAAYNAGPERSSLAKGFIPAIPETRNYVRTITTNWLRLTQLETEFGRCRAVKGGRHRGACLWVS